MPIISSVDLWLILGTMLVAGILGGIVGSHYGQAPDEQTSNWPIKSVIVGIGASFIVPIFLYLTQSKIFDALLEPEVADHIRIQNYIVFFSLCVLAAITSFRFISSISERFLAELKQTKKVAEEAQRTSEETAQKTQENRETIRAVKHVIKDNQATPAKPPVLMESNSRSFSASYLKADDDPQKGRWGGQAERNHRRLTATVEPVDSDDDMFRVRLQVTSTDPVKHPLVGNVTFHLHDTFTPSSRSIPSRNGIATLDLIAWGAFTVGAATDDGTQLELDLADNRQVSTAPEAFRQR